VAESTSDRLKSTEISLSFSEPALERRFSGEASDLLLSKVIPLPGFDRTSDGALYGTDAQVSRLPTELDIVCAVTAAQERIAEIHAKSEDLLDELTKQQTLQEQGKNQADDLFDRISMCDGLHEFQLIN
jgi:hypothetical protein